MLSLLFSTVVAFADSIDNLELYVASNGITYRVGDVIDMRRGSMSSEKFRFLYWGTLVSGDGNSSARIKQVTIKEIRKLKPAFEHTPEVIFLVKGDDYMTYSLRVDKAIDACEIHPCGISKGLPGNTHYGYNHPGSGSPVSIADELAKMKDLHEEGIISRAEYKYYSHKLLTDGAPAVSAADELRKLKMLFDQGDIDKWQYSAFKGRLLRFPNYN